MKEFLKMFVLTLPVYILLFFLFTRQDKLTPQDVINQLNQRDSIISKMIDKQGRLVVEHTNREYSPIILKTSNPFFADNFNIAVFAASSPPFARSLLM